MPFVLCGEYITINPPFDKGREKKMFSEKNLAINVIWLFTKRPCLEI